LGAELAAGVDAHVLVADLEHAAGKGDVARFQDVRELGGLDAIGGEPLLRIVDVDLLGQDPGEVDLGHDGHGEQRALDEVGVVLQLAVAVAVAGGRAQAGLDLAGVTDDEGPPEVRVQLGGAQALADEGVDEAEEESMPMTPGPSKSRTSVSAPACSA